MNRSYKLQSLEYSYCYIAQRMMVNTEQIRFDQKGLEAEEEPLS